jgi:hypothetical protein
VENFGIGSWLQRRRPKSGSKTAVISGNRELAMKSSRTGASVCPTRCGIGEWSKAKELREQYRPFTEKLTPWAERLDTGEVSPPDAFRIRTELMDAWRAFPGSDPVPGWEQPRGA